MPLSNGTRQAGTPGLRQRGVGGAGESTSGRSVKPSQVRRTGRDDLVFLNCRFKDASRPRQAEKNFRALLRPQRSPQLFTALDGAATPRTRPGDLVRA